MDRLMDCHIHMAKQIARPQDREKWDDKTRTDRSKDGKTAVEMDGPTGRMKYQQTD